MVALVIGKGDLLQISSLEIANFSSTKKENSYDKVYKNQNLYSTEVLQAIDLY